MVLVKICVVRRENFTLMVFEFDGFVLKECVNHTYSQDEIDQRAIMSTTVLGLN